MPQPKKGARLGSNPSHQRLMLANLAASLFEHEQIRTTEAKAKLLRPYAGEADHEGEGNTVHHRRQVLAEIQDRDTVHKLFSEIGPRFSDRNGGYTASSRSGHVTGMRRRWRSSLLSMPRVAKRRSAAADRRGDGRSASPPSLRASASQRAALR